MHYKYLYIIFFSIMFSQSFFNRILPGEVYEGDAKSMAIGNSSLTASNGSGVIISNPAKILSKDNQSAKIKISSFQDLINQANKEKEIELKYDLERNVKLVSFNKGKIDISFNTLRAKI